MQVTNSFIPYFVRVDCEPHSRHRNPHGVYLVEVPYHNSQIESAYVAIQTIKNQVTFMQENEHRSSVRVFTEGGDEIRIPSSLRMGDFLDGFFLGRAINFPTTISLQ